MFNLKEIFSPKGIKKSFAQMMYNDRAVLYCRVMETQYFKSFNFLNVTKEQFKKIKAVTVNKEMFLNTNYVLLDSLKCLRNTKFVLLVAQDWTFLNGTRYMAKIDLDKNTKVLQIMDTYMPSLLNLLEVPNIVYVAITEDSVGTIKEEWLSLKDETPQCNLLKQ